MTRLGLLAAFLAAPAALLDDRQSAVGLGGHSFRLGPGTYHVGSGGGIWALEARGIRIKNCTFTPGPHNGSEIKTYLTHASAP